MEVGYHTFEVLDHLAPSLQRCPNLQTLIIPEAYVNPKNDEADVVETLANYSNVENIWSRLCFRMVYKYMDLERPSDTEDHAADSAPDDPTPYDILIQEYEVVRGGVGNQMYVYI